MMVLLSLHLPVAAVMSDVCDYLDLVDDDVTAYYNDTVGQVLEGCLDDDKLVEILGLDDQLQFTDNIEFPEMGDIAEDFQFDAFSNFSDEGQSVDYTTFHGPGNEALEGINTLIADCIDIIEIDLGLNFGMMTLYEYPQCAVNRDRVYSRDNYSDIDPSDYYNATSEYSEIQVKCLLILHFSFSLKKNIFFVFSKCSTFTSSHCMSLCTVHSGRPWPI